MDILWHGRSCFTIKGKNATIVTDPYAGTGFKTSKLKADIIVSNLPTSEIEPLEVDGEHILFDMPGEYERYGVAIRGIQAWNMSKKKEEESKKESKKVTVFVMDIDGIKICHLGNIGHTLTDELMQSIGSVDILLIPVGGKETIDAKKAVEIIEDIEPRIVIPMHFKADGEKLDIAGVNEFLKEVGAKNESIEKFSIENKSKLPQDHEEYVVLNPVV